MTIDPGNSQEQYVQAVRAKRARLSGLLLMIASAVISVMTLSVVVLFLLSLA